MSRKPKTKAKKKPARKPRPQAAFRRVDFESEVARPHSGESGRPLKARVHVTLKSGVLDPQGKAIQNALAGLGFKGVGDVRQGKFIEIALAEKDVAKARASVENMCRKLLANTVIENYSIEIGK